MNGDATKARQGYLDFSALWKDADADLPLLIEAKKQYEKMKGLWSAVTRRFGIVLGASRS